MPTPKAAKSLLDYLNTVGGDVLGAPKGLYNTLRHPYDTNVQPLQDLASQSRQQFNTGHPVKGTLSAIASGLPVIGPAAASLSSEVGNGQYAKALGHLTSAGGLALMGDEVGDAGQGALTRSLVSRAGAEQAGKNAVNSRVSSLIQELNQPDLRTAEQRVYSPKPLARPSAPPEASLDPGSIGIGPVTTDNPQNAAYPNVVPPRGQNEVQSEMYKAPRSPFLLPGQHPSSSAGIDRIQSLVDMYLPSEKPVVGTPLSDADSARIVSGPPVPYKGLHPAGRAGQEYINDIVEKMLNDMGHEDEE